MGLSVCAPFHFSVGHVHKLNNVNNVYTKVSVTLSRDAQCSILVTCVMEYPLVLHIQ